MKFQDGRALAWAGVLVAGALWGGGALVAQWLISGGMSPWSVAFGRFALGLPGLWLLHLAGEAPGWRALPRRQRGLIGIAGLAMAGSVCAWFEAIARMGAALPTVISVCSAPVIVAAASVARGYEPLTRRLAVALALALAGVALVVVPEAGGAIDVAGLACSFASAGFYAVVVLCNARMPAAVPAVAAATWSMSVATPCLGVAAAIAGWTWPAGLPQWAGVAYGGVAATSVGYLLFAWGARKLSPTATVIGALVEPLVAAALAAYLDGHGLPTRQWIGAALLGVAMLAM